MLNVKELLEGSVTSIVVFTFQPSFSSCSVQIENMSDYTESKKMLSKFTKRFVKCTIIIVTILIEEVFKENML